MYRPSDFKSWTSHSASRSTPSHPSTLPGPMPVTPHLHTVSLPHPNAASRYASSSQYPSHHEGSSGILSLNPLLSAPTGLPPMYYNITRDIQYIQFQPGSQNLLDTPAVWPSCSVLVLSLPSLPLWSTIEIRNPSGVTARDVLVRIRNVIGRGVSPAEMGTMISISTAFASASEYFRARTRTDPREFAQGVKRIDFLGPNVLFAGLWRSRDGQDRWEVRFVPAA